MQELNRQGAIAMDIILPDASSQIREALASKLNTEDEKIKQIGSVLYYEQLQCNLLARWSYDRECSGIYRLQYAVQESGISI